MKLKPWLFEQNDNIIKYTKCELTAPLNRDKKVFENLESTAAKCWLIASTEKSELQSSTRIYFNLQFSLRAEIGRLR